jgi:hypothetical protein
MPSEKQDVLMTKVILRIKSVRAYTRIHKYQDLLCTVTFIFVHYNKSTGLEIIRKMPCIRMASASVRIY